MSNVWIGIADDLTEHEVVGRPYMEPNTPEPINVPRAEYPAPPKNGQSKTLLMIAGILTVFMLTPPGSAILNSIRSALAPSKLVLAPQPAAAFDTESGNIKSAYSIADTQHKQASTSANQQAANESLPKKKQEKQKRASTNSASPPTDDASKLRLFDVPASESEIELSKYRNLSGRI